MMEAGFSRVLEKLESFGEKMYPMVARVQWVVVCVGVTERFGGKYVSRIRELFFFSEILNTVTLWHYLHDPLNKVHIKSSWGAPTKGFVEQCFLCENKTKHVLDTLIQGKKKSDNENKWFFGWPDQYFDYKSTTDEKNRARLAGERAIKLIFFTAHHSFCLD